MIETGKVMKHFFIISGGNISDGFAVAYLKQAFLQEAEGETSEINIIAADSGLEFCYRNHILPQSAAGDFDSVTAETLAYFRRQQGIAWHPLPSQKDDTDTEAAVRMALRNGAEKITILGGTGNRLDHVLGNIELLGIGMEAGVPMELVDACNRIRMISSGIVLKKERQFGKYVSLLPYTDCVRHLCLTGFLYPLSDACLRGFCSLGISNEIVEDEAEIRFDGGILLVLETSDGDETGRFWHG